MSVAGKGRGMVLFLCYLGFISLGLPDTVVGVAWPSVRQEFGLRHGDLSWIFFGAGCSYFLSSFFAGRFLRRFNIGVLLAASSGLVALAGFDYAFARVWPLFAAGALLHGLGSGAIDAGLNHYVASHFSARHMNWLHACYSLGAMLGPAVMTAMIGWGDSWRMGYLVVAVTLGVLSMLFLGTQRRWDDEEKKGEIRQDGQDGEEDSGNGADGREVSAGVALRQRTVWLHIVVFFFYTGLEVALGQWSYTVLTERRGIEPKVAGGWVTVYWGSILAGRIFFGFVVERLGIDRLIRGSLAVAVAGTGLFAWNPVWWAAPVALGLAGLGLAVIFPLLMTRTPQRMGKGIAAHAIGFQVGAAMLGAAALPSVTGWIAEAAGLGWVPVTVFLMAAVLFGLHEGLLLLTRGDGGQATR